MRCKVYPLSWFICTILPAFAAGYKVPVRVPLVEEKVARYLMSPSDMLSATEGHSVQVRVPLDEERVARYRVPDVAFGYAVGTARARQ